MTREQVLINHIQEYLDSGMWQYEACYLNKDDLKVIIKALEQKPYEKFENVKDHIYKLASDYKCWDNRITDDEAIELCHILEQEPILDKIIDEMQGLRNCSCSCSDGIIDDVEDIIDKYRK